MAAAAATKSFRTGTKQIFLPDHMITFLRPKDNQPPQFATFKVPLTFNKLDIRDYLLHAYDVSVKGVRSQLRQQKPRRSAIHHRVSRPAPIKTMTVELASPFVWPARPADTEAWDSDAVVKRAEGLKRQRAWSVQIQKTGKMPLREQTGPDAARLALRDEARRLLREGGWQNKRVLDVRFGVKPTPADGAVRDLAKDTKVVEQGEDGMNMGEMQKVIEGMQAGAGGKKADLEGARKSALEVKKTPLLERGMGRRTDGR
ncbi:Uu.00g017200.m01.CDS01 [Anthostomella pinea]|uniref:Large ribosomal subunit protein uL23m n=1 Tax=Anthostomella pinea TaxID=933095 RepID=A0AAI8VT21_9PEZI|nr:Uu.00g017200.m01.CDS01 [Anthostomella pinea]